MATNIRHQIRILQSDGTDFSTANEAGAALRLRVSDSAGADQGAIGAFTEINTGVWYINIDIDIYDTQYFLVQWFTTASGVYAAVNGFAPYVIPLQKSLMLAGGTMTGDIAMGDKSVTGVDAITFTDVDGLIAGIANKNLLDKTAAETITGNYTMNGAVILSSTLAVAGNASFANDKLFANSIIVSPYEYVTWNFITAGMNKANVNGTVFIADAAYHIVSIHTYHEVNEATAGICKLQFEKLLDTEAEGAGAAILTDAGNTGIDMKAGAQTVQIGTLHATNKILAATNRIAILLSADSTELEGLHVTMCLKRV